MPSLAGGNTETVCSKLKNPKRFLKPNFETLQSLRKNRGQAMFYGIRERLWGYDRRGKCGLSPISARVSRRSLIAAQCEPFICHLFYFRAGNNVSSAESHTRYQPCHTMPTRTAEMGEAGHKSDNRAGTSCICGLTAGGILTKLDVLRSERIIKTRGSRMNDVAHSEVPTS
jgi:hypothetical protein